MTLLQRNKFRWVCTESVITRQAYQIVSTHTLASAYLDMNLLINQMYLCKIMRMRMTIEIMFIETLAHISFSLIKSSIELLEFSEADVLIVCK